MVAIIMIPLATFAARTLGKRMTKVALEHMEKAGDLNKYLVEIFKNHNLIKIFQREKYENSRAEKYINDMKKKSIKINTIFVRTSPIMESLTGIIMKQMRSYNHG